MSQLREFTAATARPLPVILLVDVSGSMKQDDKIDALNRAVAEMFASLAEEEDLRAEIQIAVIAFGKGGARLHVPLTPATNCVWTDLEAGGKTPLGACLTLAAELIEDRIRIPSRAYRPTVVLVSDGNPSDDWETPLKRLLESERGAKAVRLAMAIGADAELTVLESFVGNPTLRVFRADEARQIRHFFRFVTMSVSTRSRDVRPDKTRDASPDEWEDLDF